MAMYYYGEPLSDKNKEIMEHKNSTNCSTFFHAYTRRENVQCTLLIK